MENTGFRTRHVNDKGRGNLISWLEGVLEGERALFADAWADRLIEGVNGALDDGCMFCVEVPRTKTRSGAAEVYDFDGDEYDVIVLDEDGTVIS
jgi:hypothetical protein